MNVNVLHIRSLLISNTHSSYLWRTDQSCCVRYDMAAEHDRHEGGRTQHGESRTTRDCHVSTTAETTTATSGSCSSGSRNPDHERRRRRHEHRGDTRGAVGATLQRTSRAV